MAITPNTTLTATLDDLTGAPAGSLANPAKLRIALCGFGPILPLIGGTAMLAKTGPFAVYSTGSPISIQLWGNDQIAPSNTYYSIEILDGQDNVVQCGAYQFIGGGTFDLSTTVQIVPPYGFSLGGLGIANCTLTAPRTYQAPGQVVAAFYNGLLMRPGTGPGTDYTLSGGGTIINLNFSTELGDSIYALCIQV
jgi:hypothetical protein